MIKELIIIAFVNFGNVDEVYITQAPSQLEIFQQKAITINESYTAHIEVVASFFKPMDYFIDYTSSYDSLSSKEGDMSLIRIQAHSLCATT